MRLKRLSLSSVNHKDPFLLNGINCFYHSFVGLPVVDYILSVVV